MPDTSPTVAEQLAAIDIVEHLAASVREHSMRGNGVLVAMLSSELGWLRHHIDERERHRALAEAVFARWAGALQAGDIDPDAADATVLGAAIYAAIDDIGATLTLPGDTPSSFDAVTRRAEGAADTTELTEITDSMPPAAGDSA